MQKVYSCAKEKAKQHSPTQSIPLGVLENQRSASLVVSTHESTLPKKLEQSHKRRKRQKKNETALWKILEQLEEETGGKELD